MTSSTRPSSFFRNSAITRAERTYQQRSVKPPRPWRRWVNFTAKWLAVTLSLILFGGLLLASITVRDPLPIAEKLYPLPNILTIVAVIYHIYLMFLTISRTANSISREKEAQTWDMLVLTGIDARQIVRGKWWATIQQQFPQYLLLSVLRIGATAAAAISMTGIFYRYSSYYNSTVMLPHPVTILLVALVAFMFTMANLAFSAACGVMASAASKRSVVAIARGFGNQVVLSLVTGISFIYIVSRLFTYSDYASFITLIYNAILGGAVSLIDNGFTLTTSTVYVGYFLYYDQQGSGSPILPINLEWMVGVVIALLLYALLIWFALWRAERGAVKEMATPVNS